MNRSLWIPTTRLLLATAALFAFYAAPTAGSQTPPGAAAALPGPADASELRAFLDGLLQQQMEEHHIAGAAVSVVKDGALLYAAGYGHADLENGIPVDPESTLFRIASVTKSFTATAVMQLVEHGRLDLDADVNSYLDFRIPDTYPQRITLRHLLTHTAGFEDLLFEVLALEPADVWETREWLVTHRPERVRPPGDVAAYSNYGSSLAGYIVARVTGQSFDEYLLEHVLTPLRMAHTTSASPLPADLAASASKGYTFTEGRFEAAPWYLGQVAGVPAGGLWSTAADMARFMIMHLQDGLPAEADAGDAAGSAGAARERVLLPETAQTMHATQYSPDPRLLGTALGFFDFTDNGQPTIGHSGESFPMSCIMLLLPGLDLGVFVVYNSQGGEDLTNQHLGFQRAFFDHYFPGSTAGSLAPAPDTRASATAASASPIGPAEPTTRLAGRYRMSRGSYTTLEKVGVLFATVGVTDAGGGSLVLDTPWGAWNFQEVEPLYYRQTDGQFNIAFRQDDRGQVTHLLTDITPMFAFERLRWFEAPTFNLALVAVCVVGFLSVIVVTVARGVRRRRQGGVATRGQRLAEGLIVLVAALNLAFVIGTAAWGQPAPLFGVSAIYRVVLGLGVAAALLTVGAVVAAVLVWVRRYWGVGARVHYALATVAAVAFVWFLDSWNLLGWRF